MESCFGYFREQLFLLYFCCMKILVVRFSSIGDVVLTTPVIRCLKTQIPDLELHYLTKKSMFSILEGNSHVDRFYTIEKSIGEIIPQLKSEQYDVLIDLHHNVRTLKLKRALGVKSYAFPKKNIAKFLLTTFKVNRMPKVHVVDRYFEAVKPLGVSNDGKPCEVILNVGDVVDLRANQLVSGSFVAVAMGAQYATKQMPVQLLSTVLSGVGFPVVLLGGKEDRQRAKELQDALPGQQMIDFTGQLSLKQSAYLCKEAKVLLTGDTGLMHIASAFETPAVSVWGNTVPDLGMYFYAPQKPESYSIHQVEGLRCRPCSKIGYQSCPKKHFNCMSLQDTGAIREDLTKRFEDN